MRANLELDVQMAGRFKVEVRRADGNWDVAADWFDNLITDGGLDRLGENSTGAVWSYCRAGSGNTVPAVTDTQLASQLGSSSTASASTSGIDLANGFIWQRKTWEFAQGAVVGNVAELGTGWSATGATLFSRALVKDSGGNPTTVPVAADETLRVSWEIRQYWPTVDASGSVTFTGSIGGTYNWVSRAARVGKSDTYGMGYWGLGSGSGGGIRLDTYAAALNIYYGGDLGDITGSPTFTRTSTVSAVSAYSVAAYVAGSRKSKTTIRLDLSTGNDALGIKSIDFSTYFLRNTYQMSFTPAIPKTANDVLTLDVTVGWGRRA